MSPGKPTLIKRKLITPASGEEREIESITSTTQKLITSFTALNVQPQLIGFLQSDDAESPRAVLAYATIARTTL